MRLTAILLVSLGCLGGCGKPSVVGIWESTREGDVHGKRTFSFKDDGTYTEYSSLYVDSTKSNWVIQISGTYTFEDDTLVTNLTDGKQDIKKMDTGESVHFDFDPSTLTRKIAWFDSKKFSLYPDPKTGMGGPFPTFVKK
jgi:hypothetical protein